MLVKHKCCFLRLVIFNYQRILNNTENELKLMFVFCIPSVWQPHEDEEPALTTYRCPPSPDHSASATHPTNSPRGRLLMLITQEENLNLDHLLHLSFGQEWSRLWNLWRTEDTQRHLPGTEWTGLNWAQVNLTGDRLTHFSSTEEKWTVFQLTSTDVGWHSSRILSFLTKGSFLSPFLQNAESFKSPTQIPSLPQTLSKGLGHCLKSYWGGIISSSS